MTVATAARSADGNEDHGCIPHAVFQFGGEGKPARSGIARDQRRQARLVDGNLATLEGRDLAGILVDADDLVSEIGEADAGHQAYVARTHHCDLHAVLP